MKKLIASLAVFASLAAATPAHAAPGAVLRGLDKLSGQARDFTAPIGRPVKFGTLEITVRALLRQRKDASGTGH